MTVLRLTEEQISMLEKSLEHVRGEGNWKVSTVYGLIQEAESILRQAECWQKVFDGTMYVDYSGLNGQALFIESQDVHEVREIYRRVREPEPIPDVLVKKGDFQA